MKYQNSIKLYVLCTMANLAGCAGEPSVAGPESASGMQVRQSTVYIVPNCQVLGGETYCQWIEPRNAAPVAPARAVEQTASGIAL